LAKGHYLSWDHRHSTYEINSYQNTAGEPFITDASLAREYLYSSLKAAVNRQLISDAPIGVFLSGGIDSSLISILANPAKGTAS